MTSDPFVSFAQNGEDVVLWRALRHVGRGAFVEIGGNDPTELSVSRAFYDRGWHGVVVEPVAGYAAEFRRQRPRDVVVEAAITTAEGPITLHQIDGTGLSSLSEDVARHQRDSGWVIEDVEVSGRRLDSVLEENFTPGDAIHFMLVDVEGGEPDVIRSVDLTRWRPWVLVVEATEPLSNRQTHESWEDMVLAAGYRFCLFDGLSRFYVSPDHEDLAPALSYPACALDESVPWSQVQLIEDRGRLEGELQRVQTENVRLRAEREAMEPASAAAVVTEAALADARADVDRWRTLAIDGWSIAGPVVEAGAVPSVTEAELRRELQSIQHTLSWRVTKPLRTLRRIQLGPGGGR